MKKLESLPGKPPSVEADAAKKIWVKPTAVSAKVQDVTQNGHAVIPVSDFVTCAS